MYLQLYFCRFPDVFTQFRVALEKQGIRVRRLINIPANFKPIPEGPVPAPLPTLLDFGYPSVKNSYFILR